jgi:hypothetical protein
MWNEERDWDLQGGSRRVGWEEDFGERPRGFEKGEVIEIDDTVDVIETRRFLSEKQGLEDLPQIGTEYNLPAVQPDSVGESSWRREDSTRSASSSVRKRKRSVDLIEAMSPKRTDLTSCNGFMQRDAQEAIDVDLFEDTPLSAGFGNRGSRSPAAPSQRYGSSKSSDVEILDTHQSFQEYEDPGAFGVFNELHWSPTPPPPVRQAEPDSSGIEVDDDAWSRYSAQDADELENNMGDQEGLMRFEPGSLPVDRESSPLSEEAEEFIAESIPRVKTPPPKAGQAESRADLMKRGMPDYTPWELVQLQVSRHCKRICIGFHNLIRTL